MTHKVQVLPSLAICVHRWWGTWLGLVCTRSVCTPPRPDADHGRHNAVMFSDISLLTRIDYLVSTKWVLVHLALTPVPSWCSVLFCSLFFFQLTNKEPKVLRVNYLTLPIIYGRAVFNVHTCWNPNPMIFLL